MINYTNALREHNLKATPQRLAITEILELNGHVNIEDLYDRMVRKFNSISLATIYKNVNLMLENSFIQEVKIPYSKSVYELTKSTHSHLVCTKCSSIEDIKIDLDAIQKRANETTQFQINSAEIVFSGICENCKE
jgi:Fur family transcriptional regulator, peroxide stress response regulator